MLNLTNNDNEEEYYEEDQLYDEDENHIPLPPKDLIMPEFISDDSGIFVPPMLNSIDLSDLGVEKVGSSISQCPSIFPILTLTDELNINSNGNGQAKLKRHSTLPSLKPNESLHTLPTIGEISPQQKEQNTKLINSYFEEEYAMLYNLPHNATNIEILGKLKSYSIHIFAKTNFRKHHIPNFNMKYYTTEELTSFSDKPLYKMLLKKVPDGKKELGKAISIIILRYAKAIESDNIDMLPGALVSALRENNDAIDETYFQLIKYSNNCPNRDILVQVWKLWLIIGTLFPVSEDVRPYVFSFLIRIVYKCKDPLGEIPRSRSASSFHDSKSALTLVSPDNDSAEVILSNNSIYQEDITFVNIAKFVFMRMYERTFKIGSIYTKELSKEAFINMPKAVRFGRSMFSCSLYEVMWCQKRFYPALTIPLPLHLIIKQIKKNGGLFTPEFFVLKNRPESRSIINTWINKLPMNNAILEDGEINELVALLFYFLFNMTDSLIPKSCADVFIEKCQSKKYNDIFTIIPSLHANTIKYLIGFIQEVSSYQQYNLMSKEQIAEIFSKFFVETHKKIIEPFKRHTMNELANGFIIYCIENLDCKEFYPLNPGFERRAILKKRSETDVKNNISSPLTDQNKNIDNHPKKDKKSKKKLKKNKDKHKT